MSRLLVHLLLSLPLGFLLCAQRANANPRSGSEQRKREGGRNETSQQSASPESAGNSSVEGDSSESGVDGKLRDAASSPAVSDLSKRTELNLLGKTNAEGGESRRNENVQFNLIDDNSLKELNIRLGTTPT